MSDKIIINTGTKRNKKDEDLLLNKEKKQALPPEKPVKSEAPIPLDENVWGNDYKLVKKLDEKVLADRRLFVRVRHIQKVNCTVMYDKNGMQPIELPKPIQLLVIDVSMGGIGVISEQEINVGDILGIQLILDNIPYDIKCEVVYCFPSENKYRAGLKLAQKDKRFVKHLKIYVARISLTSQYGHARNDKE